MLCVCRSQLIQVTRNEFVSSRQMVSNTDEIGERIGVLRILFPTTHELSIYRPLLGGRKRALTFDKASCRFRSASSKLPICMFATASELKIIADPPNLSTNSSKMNTASWNFAPPCCTRIRTRG